MNAQRNGRSCELARIQWPFDVASSQRNLVVYELTLLPNLVAQCAKPLNEVFGYAQLTRRRSTVARSNLPIAAFEYAFPSE